MVMQCYGFKPGQGEKARGTGFECEKAPTLNTSSSCGGGILMEHKCYGISAYESNAMKSGNPNSGIYEADTSRTLDMNGGNPACNQGGVAVCERIPQWIVRRLMPIECERLQGFPDNWTDIGEWTDSKGKKRQTTDGARYKALGNSIALPFWRELLRNISATYDRPATLGSLFDGIGGFPLVFEQINGKGSCRWASEIEPFPIAVTKVRFPDDEK